MKENDDVNNPKHYQIFPDQQAIDVIQAALTEEEFAGYCKGNALKYRLRAGSKGDTLKCIAKANWYQNKLREAKRDSEEGNRIASAEHRDELECLVVALEKIADLELPSTEGVTEFGRSQDRWRKFLEAQGIAESAIAQYREEPVTHDAKTLTAGELKAGGWWCADVSEDCANAFIAKGLRVFNSGDWGVDEEWGVCVLNDTGRVTRLYYNDKDRKQIHRIGNDFYWSNV